MKKNLMEKFGIKNMDIDVINKKVRMTTTKKVDSKEIISYLEKKGCYLNVCDEG